MNARSYSKQLALGALAGGVGTAFIKGGMAASERWAPETLPPVKQDPGEFMVQRAERALPARARRKIPEKAERAAAQALGFGYGMTFGSLYAALPRNEHAIARDGTLLGLVTWAASFLGWLPWLGLTPPVSKQKPKRLVPNLVSHALFGMITVAALGALEKRA